MVIETSGMNYNNDPYCVVEDRYRSINDAAALAKAAYSAANVKLDAARGKQRVMRGMLHDTIARCTTITNDYQVANQVYSDACAESGAAEAVYCAAMAAAQAAAQEATIKRGALRAQLLIERETCTKDDCQQDSSTRKGPIPIGLQPIATAPKDGSVILVWAPGMRSYWIASFRFAYRGEPQFDTHGRKEWRDDHGCWATPTHWMKLP